MASIPNLPGRFPETVMLGSQDELCSLLLPLTGVIGDLARYYASVSRKPGGAVTWAAYRWSSERISATPYSQIRSLPAS